jgi:hypothetical protein
MNNESEIAWKRADVAQFEVLDKHLPMPVAVRVRPPEAELFPYGRTDMKNLTVAFRKFANALKSCL